jgi:hypothetical protein
VEGVLDARLLLLHLGLRGRPDADLRHAADELRKALLQLLAVVVGGGGIRVLAELLGARLDARGVSGAL